jgi:prepilin-type N-terminal cleavage/methylation domain-containing protein
MQLWNAPKKNRGFTLIEMLVVVIIVGILAAVAVPNLLGLIYKARITDGAADIEGAMKEAQRQAIRLSKTCNIELVKNAADNWTVQPAAGVQNNNCLLEARVLPEGVTAKNNFMGSMFYSGKGNIGAAGSWVITVSHSNISQEKCLLISGVFGDIQSGIYTDTDGDASTVEASGCSIN